MKKKIDPNNFHYTERYKDHELLSEDILEGAKEKVFFDNLRDRVKDARKELDLTQRDFGEDAGIDRRYVAKVECGSQRPSFKFIKNISIKHKISLDWLFYGVGEKYINIGNEKYGDKLHKFKKLLDRASEEDIHVIMAMIGKIV